MNRKLPPPQIGKKGKVIDQVNNEEEPLPETGSDTFNLNNGKKYIGEWKRFENVFKRHGKGEFISDEFIYKGEFKEDLFHGYGSLKYSDGREYNGEFRNGEINGKGAMQFEDLSIYNGQWRNGRMHGLGTFSTSKGDQWTGLWNNGISHCPIYPQRIPDETDDAEEERYYADEEDYQC